MKPALKNAKPVVANAEWVLRAQRAMNRATEKARADFQRHGIDTKDWAPPAESEEVAFPK
jgi:hypothetical protein